MGTEFNCVDDFLEEFNCVDQEDLDMGYPNAETVQLARNFIKKLRDGYITSYGLLCEASPDMEGGILLRFLNGITLQISLSGSIFPSKNNCVAKEYFFFDQINDLMKKYFSVVMMNI